jgi:cystathionine beta-lyase
MSDTPADHGPATRLIHAVTGPTMDSPTVGPPIVRGSTVLMPNAASLYDDDLVSYGRSGLVTQRTLCQALADMEGAAHCQLFPSGLAAVAGAMLAVLKAGDQVLVADCAYGPTQRFCDKVLKRYGVDIVYFPPRASAEAIFALAGPALRLVVMESPGSLTFELQDIDAIAGLARERGALTLLDNTWGAGLLLRPLAHGIDLSVQALTKYVGGHSDVFMGSVCANDPKMIKALDDAILNFGWSVSPDDAYQALRGLRTLPVRLARHGESALEIAAWLSEQPQILKVLHPALPDSPDHALWKRDYAGACGLFSIVLQPAPDAAVDAFLDALTLFGLGFSWGGFESLAISSGGQLRHRKHHAPLGGPLVRLHIGLEDVEDLKADLHIGLAAFNAAR